jgi:hypothetical protein
VAYRAELNYGLALTSSLLSDTIDPETTLGRWALESGHRRPGLRMSREDHNGVVGVVPQVDQFVVGLPVVRVDR